MKTLLVLTLLLVFTLQVEERSSLIVVSPTVLPQSTPAVGENAGGAIVLPDLTAPLDIVPSVPTNTGEYTPVLSEGPSNHEEIVKLRTSKTDWNVLGYSGDGSSTKVLYSGTPDKLPSDFKFTIPAKTKSSISQPTLREVSVNPFPWLPSAKLATPGPTTIIINTGLIVIYEITFYNDCPTNQLVMHLHAWDSFFVWDPTANQQIYPSSGWAYPICHSIKLPRKCGCNKLWIVLYNWQQPSFYSIWYELYQTQTGCYDCLANPGDSFYNRTSCKCQCSFECDCSSFSKIWYGYPTCGCRCRASYMCESLKYFNQRTCKCECKPICCPTGMVQSTSTCLCVRKNPFIDQAVNVGVSAGVP